MEMDYKQAYLYIQEAMKKGSVLGLTNIKELLRRLGNPQNKLPIIHIAGTNGKGSTLAFISTILKCAGYKVGRYISPTIFEYRERIQINEKYISEKSFAKIISRIKPIVFDMHKDGYEGPTAFELETVISFIYFLEEQCDVVVLETGLGGEEDATNVMEQVLCSVITSISLDHVDILGDTIEKIAKVKAGIIKEKCPVVVAKQEDNIIKEIKRKAFEKNSPLIITKNYTINVNKCEAFHQSFTYESHNKINYHNMEISLLGLHQISNCVTALEVIEILRQKGYNISDEAVRRGCIETKWPGRLECISRSPLFFVDGAHNPDAVEKLRESIEMYFTKRKIVFIMGVLSDKDYEKMIEIISPLASKIITVEPENPRKLPARELAQKISDLHLDVTAADGYKQAIMQAIDTAGEKGVIIAFGSLYYLGDLIRVYRDEKGLEYSYDR